MAFWKIEKETEDKLQVDLREIDSENGKFMKPAKARHIMSNGGLWYYQCWAYDRTIRELHIHSVLK
jgi:hypothetical protein